MNFTEQFISIMIAGSASEIILSPYVVYKSKELYKIWLENGPKGTMYNRSKSCCSDRQCFEDWLVGQAILYLRKLPGKKVLFGDNLSLQLLAESVRLCCQENILLLVFLPSNSTHMNQLLIRCGVLPSIETKVDRDSSELESWCWKKREQCAKNCIPKITKTIY